MIRIDLQMARLIPLATAITIASVGQVPLDTDDDQEAKVQAEELRQQKFDLVMTARLKRQFDQLVFANGGFEPGARREFELSLAKRVEQFDRACELTDSQRKKLLAAGRGDMKRFFDRVEDARRRIPEVMGGVPGPVLNQIPREAAPLRKEREKILAGDGSIFKNALQHTLTEPQLDRFRRDKSARGRNRYRASVRWTVVMLARSLGLTDDQRQRLEALLVKETRTPQEFVVSDYQIVMYQASLIPEPKIKPIFDDLQWRVLSQELTVARNQGQWLKNGGHLNFEMIGD